MNQDDTHLMVVVVRRDLVRIGHMFTPAEQLELTIYVEIAHYGVLMKRAVRRR